MIDELEKEPEVAACYETWNRLRDGLEAYYKDSPRKRLPLSQQKEFRAIKNMAIREAENIRLGVTSFEDEEPVSVEELEEAAALGDGSAMYRLGRLYLQGREVPQDKEKALRWLENSAAQGNVYAQYLIDRIDDQRDPSILLAATRLLHHVSRVFRERAMTKNPKGIRVDSRRRRQLLQKRLALGHKIDDHEEQAQSPLSQQRM